MKKRITLATGLVALGIAGLIIAQENNINGHWIRGPKIDGQSTWFNFRQSIGESPDVPGVLRLTYKSRNKGAYKFYYCEGGDLPPFCPSATPPPDLRECGGWPYAAVVDAPATECPPTETHHFLVYAETSPDNFELTDDWTFAPPYRGSCSLGYNAQITRPNTPEACKSPTPSPTPTPTPTATPTPTIPPSPTPMNCSPGYHYCPPEWVYYPGCGSYWTSGTCCPDGWECQTTWSWSNGCLISNCCHYDEWGNFFCLQ